MRELLQSLWYILIILVVVKIVQKMRGTSIRANREKQENDPGTQEGEKHGDH
jgi:hypothetical protein